ncbi:MAG TPA: HAMP domain-containing protein, partial [Kofleriaceae bacterium]
MASRGWGLVPKTILPTIVVSVVIASAVGIVLYLDEKASVIGESRKTAIAIAQQTLAERQVYTANVVNPLLRDFGGPDQGFTTGNNTIHWVTSKMHNPKDKGSLPLPAALVHLVSASVNSRGAKGHTLDLLSLDAVNPEKNPLKTGGSPTEISAMQFLQSEKNPLTYREAVSGEGVDARYVLWYPDIAADACVSCHNGLGGGHKNDWVRGDVMGSIKVTLPMGTDLENAKSGAFRIMLLVLGAFAVVALLQTLLQWLFVSRPLIRNLNMLERAAERISHGEVDQPIKIESNDEVGRLGQSFERMRTSLVTLLDEA